MTSSHVLAAICLSLATSIAHAELIDRVLAVVDGQIVTLSDVRAALRLGLVPPDVSDDPVQAGLRRLIDRRLMLVEVDRYAPDEPSPGAIEAGVASVRGRFKDAQAFEDALKQSPMTPDVLRRYIRDSLRIDAYLEQRFSSTAKPSDDEILEYYKQHPLDFTVNGALQPLPAVREQVIVRMAEDRRAQAIKDWLAGLWRRGSIVMLPSAARS